MERCRIKKFRERPGRNESRIELPWLGAQANAYSEQAYDQAARRQQHTRTEPVGDRSKDRRERSAYKRPHGNRRRSKRATPAKLIADRLQHDGHGNVTYAGRKKPATIEIATMIQP